MKINSLETYRQCGERAGNARRHKDEGVARWQTDWFNRTKMLETPEYRIQAEAAFRDGYKEGATTT